MAAQVKTWICRMDILRSIKPLYEGLTSYSNLASFIFLVECAVSCLKEGEDWYGTLVLVLKPILQIMFYATMAFTWLFVAITVPSAPTLFRSKISN